MREEAVRALWADVQAIRSRSPLVHNITNYVVMNTTANALLAIGASPVMAHAEEEVEAMVELAGALVVNIGTLSPPWVRAMERAMWRAHERGMPIVFDPVGVGATPYRTETARMLIEHARPTVIRGNASEIASLAGVEVRTKGVDSTLDSESVVGLARKLSSELGCVICISGRVDYIASGGQVRAVHNGHPLMPRVTGMGCTASALCGAFVAVNTDFAQATTHAMAVMGIAGELAAEGAEGPASFQVRFLDALYRLSEADIQGRLRME
ncbi:MAG: hydroxyethylthiazole kinase [Bacteroidetes bacterium]|nr:hydroxyethylthiazole kinase [Rhodothermia bacterium]MCX7906683.1 hydroxyethylthiazole kinase [Bacteroidota bacterium]MDW8285092.1 hydroxyethylthiazole kinase [Bacteroidota bacterium]